jgi:hypothetical protein
METTAANNRDGSSGNRNDRDGGSGSGIKRQSRRQ